MSEDEISLTKQVVAAVEMYNRYDQKAASKALGEALIAMAGAIDDLKSRKAEHGRKLDGRQLSRADFLPATPSDTPSSPGECRRRAGEADAHAEHRFGRDPTAVAAE